MDVVPAAADVGVCGLAAEADREVRAVTVHSCNDLQIV